MRLFGSQVIVHDLNPGTLLQSHYEHLRRDYQSNLPLDGVVGYANPPQRDYKVFAYIVEPLQTFSLARYNLDNLYNSRLAFGMGVFGFISARNIRQLLT